MWERGAEARRECIGVVSIYKVETYMGRLAPSEHPLKAPTLEITKIRVSKRKAFFVYGIDLHSKLQSNLLWQGYASSLYSLHNLEKQQSLFCVKH